MPDDLPRLVVDGDKVAHVLGNLLGNAIDITPPGGRVWVTAREVAGEQGREVLVEVGDSGIGIAPEHHELVFREFAQVDSSASRQHHGTGLGLTIARKLVELHDGRLWLESQLGTGSRFFFTLPVTPAAP
jgi:signal transduction histidine kinase